MSNKPRGTNPYAELENRAFWKTAVANKNLFSISDLWRPKFKIEPQHKVATYGSCFAQHIGRSLRDRNYSWLITEKAPNGISDEDSAAAGYGIFSSRTANIYTASLLKQWISWADETINPPLEVWEQNGRFFDPFRPAIEHGGFESAEELRKLRRNTISCFRKSIAEADFFVFTMGLTESWFNVAGYEYPICPGTVAGVFSPENHRFMNQDYDFISNAMRSSMEAAKKINPKLRFILTVSPVPLTATASDNHVLVATIESKSVLRAVAGKLSSERDDTDYFPSYEIINSAPFGGVFFEPNKRSVGVAGVQFVMDSFFKAVSENASKQPEQPSKTVSTSVPASASLIDHDAGCEEAMLEVYAR